MKTIPELFIAAGYSVFNLGKTDYNFTHDSFYANVSAGPKKPKGKKGKKPQGPQAAGGGPAPWRSLPKGKPFFGQIQLKGGKGNLGAGKKTDPASVTVPADYPQDDLHKGIVAQHCDTIRGDDIRIGNILAELKKDGLDKSTIVVYLSDHGANHLVRHKQQPTEAGLHVPLVIRGPEKWVPKGRVRNDLVSILDVSATTMSWAGVAYPDYIEGQNLFADDFTPRPFVGSARDRCDHTIERIRTIRTHRYRYTRNYLLDRVLLHPQYRDGAKYVKALRDGYAKGTLSPKLQEIYFGERPAEELYDMQKDPAQVNNLATSADHQAVLAQHRKILDDWLADGGDIGAGEEPDVELEMNGNGRFKGVNPEYEKVRTDSDGDGLSDMWEKYNQRDPADGKLQFEFDCGGWQTEGWKSNGDLTNIAGRQGFLDFDLLTGKASISRDGLKLDAAKNAGKLALRLRSTAKAELTVSANGKALGNASVAGTNEYATAEIPLGGAWAGTIESLKIDWAAEKGTTVEIDWIRVQ
jgi:hypothetical protein